MKITLVTKNIRRNLTKTYTDFAKSQEEAKKIALRTSQIYPKKNKLNTYMRVSRTRQTLRQVTPTTLPILGGAIGAIIPFPFLSPVLTLLGGVAGCGLYFYQKMNPKQNKITS